MINCPNSYDRDIVSGMVPGHRDCETVTLADEERKSRRKF
jgi:hypothetical protein